MLDRLTEQLRAGAPLSAAQVAAAVGGLIDETVAPEPKADFLGALTQKGETTDEIAAFARELRDRAIVPPLDHQTRAGEILDVCGTGGDRLGTFNISTAVALIVAAAEVNVAKHGNRAITSQAGSADVLEALGVPIDLAPAQAAESLRRHRFAFFFAPNFHPTFKHIAPARKLCAARGQRTIFNFLGPLLNPARPTAQLIGVPRPELCEPMARVLQSLGIRRGMVVCGTLPGADSNPENRHHLDELSTSGPNTIAEFYQDHAFSLSCVSPADFLLLPATLTDLAGGDRQTNADIIRRLLRGDDRGPKRDILLLNAGAALFVAGKTTSLTSGLDLAGQLIDSGQAAAKLAELAASPIALQAQTHHTH